MPNLSDITLVFRSGWGPAAAFGIVAAATALAYAWNRPTRAAVSKNAWRALAALQMLAALLLALWLVNPRLRYAHVDREETGLALVIDSSRSMDAKDMLDGRSRYANARDLLAAPQSPLHQALADKARLETYAFDARLRPLDANKIPDAPAAGALSTDLTQTLEALHGEAARKKLRGVVLAGDGRDTVGGDWRAAAKALGIPIYVIGFGARQNTPGAWRDAGIESIDAPTRAGMGQTVEVRAAVTQEGCAGSAIEVRLEQDGKTLDSVTTTLGADARQQVALKFKPTAVGTQTYRISIAPPPGDALPEDDAQSFSVLVSDRVLRVLYVEGRLRWVYKFLRRTLESEKSVTLDTVVRTGPGKLMQQGPTKLALRNLLPDEAALDTYDVVILGDVTRELLPDGDAQMLERFVREKKGGLLVVGGDGTLAAAGWEGSALAALLPAALDPSGAVWTPDSGAMPHVTAAGQSSGALEGLDQFLGDLALGHVYPVGAPKPGAEVWLEAGTQNPRALMTAQHYGEGRALLLASDDFWQPDLRESNAGENSQPARFWIQAVHWCAAMNDSGSESDPLIMACADKSHYAPGETAALTALVRKATKSISSAAPTLNVEGRIVLLPPGGGAPVELETFNPGQPDDKNSLHRSWLPPGDGAYAAIFKAQRGDEHAESECRFTVGRPLDELAPRDIDEDRLRALARATEGAYYTPLDAQRIPEAFERAQSAGRAVVETDLVDSPWLFAAFCVATGAGWTLRRRKNLI